MVDRKRRGFCHHCGARPTSSQWVTCPQPLWRFEAPPVGKAEYMCCKGPSLMAFKAYKVASMQLPIAKRTCRGATTIEPPCLTEDTR